MKKVIIIGAGGHGKVVADIVKLNGDRVVGYLDDKDPEKLMDYNILGTTAEIGRNSDCLYIVAVGNCEARKMIMKANARWYTAIHPNAVIAENAIISDGVCIMANVVINSNAKIGEGVIVNTAATIDHDCEIGAYVHIAPGVHVSGSVKVGELCWIGVGSSISNNISICSCSTIGAGTVVIKNIHQPGTYVGVPARLVK